MNDIRIKMLTIRSLHQLLGRQVFAVPQLQREFVWNGKRAAKLLDSIYRRMPIGTMLIWDTDRNKQNLLREQLHILPAYDPSNDELWYLIDGQQRLSVIWQSFSG